ncbi:MAG TPA: serine hydrolase [Chitinophagaceae bacterium]|nr:serine hydrolase [Chitinophagaceae bacterium]
MKKICLFLVFTTCFIANRGLCQTPSFITDSLDSYINKGLADWNIPGLAIAIVKDGKVVVMKGYGVRNVTTKEPVDENTLFMIASNSKLFTATSLAQLEYDHKLSLEDKITKYFPGYKVYDPNTTALVTIRDMLAHHLGTKTFQGDFTFWDSKLTREQIMNKMQLLKPSQNFRQSFGYCNSCFLTAGQIIPLVTGKPWEVYVYDSIIEPLGMENTHTLGANMGEMPDAATPYTNVFTGKLTELPYDRVDNLAPAGSIVSCVKDVAKWLTMQLDSGRYEGRQIIPWPVIRRTRDLNTVISSRKNPNSSTHYVGYGLGVFQCDYAGRQVFWHTGGAFGFVTNTCFVPEENLAITILTNNDNQDFFEDLRYQILDAYLGVKYVNHSAQQLPHFIAGEKKTIAATNNLQARVKGATPPLPLASYTGTYTNELYGPITISTNKNDLSIKFEGHSDLTAKLQYMDGDEWLITYSNPAFGIFPLQFKTEGNKVVSVDIKANDFVEFDPYTFIKQ